MNSASALAGLRVFVAEDEFHVLQLIEDMLAELGCAICDSVSNLRTALDRAPATEAQVAVLDVNLRGKTIFPAAQILRDRGIPIVFSTGYGIDGVGTEWKTCPVIQKPFAIERLEGVLMQFQDRISQPPPAATTRGSIANGSSENTRPSASERLTRSDGSPAPAANFVALGSQMGERIRTMDWSRTPIGPIHGWSPTLRNMVSFMLANRFPLLLWWGSEYISIYNDAYRPVLGSKDAWALGTPVRECWSEIWHILKPLIDTPFHGGPATWSDDLFLEMNRYGFIEETHFTVAYSPVPDDTTPSGIGGVMATVHEITDKIVGERRIAALRDVGARSDEAKTVDEACAIAIGALADHAKDVPFAALYLFDEQRKTARLTCATGVEAGDAAAPSSISLESAPDTDQSWPAAELLRCERTITVEELARRFPIVPSGPWSDPPHTALVVPIKTNLAHKLAGFLVAGISPRLKLDEQYRSFLELLGSRIATVIATASAYEEERKRAEALAEIDRAKTLFFSNVSHEFRTPLALMLGPLEDALAAQLPGDQRDRLDIAHRNSLRLLKLVNSLLDFSRIEAGRAQASYEPVDLAALTAELASNFRSACERAGLELAVECAPLPQPVYVDRDMWEKIVLNLLSNAFKFTFEGRIEVTIGMLDGSAALSVRDTGVGIPQHELPRLFERFHRVEGQKSRTHEGSGIGLALVQELVKLHGGQILVESEPGRGTVFTVTLPFGSAHLPSDRLSAERSLARTSVGAEAYVEEALRWLPGPQEGVSEIERELLPERSNVMLPSDGGEAVLVVDDNADMREYLKRLIAPHYEVRTAADGAAALSEMRRRRPDLLLSDVMMPRLDGFGLVREIRADPLLADLPIVLLSARAGPQANIEGLEAGADDYLVKPFGAQELLARIASNLKMARLRRGFEQRLAADFAAMQRLYEIGNLCVRSGGKFDECLRQILDAAIAITGADKGNIQLLDSKSDTLRIAVQRGFEKPFLEFFSAVHDGAGAACGAALQSADRVVVEDVARSEIFVGTPSLPVMLAAGARAVQSTPLRSSNGAVMGMISTHFARPHRPGEQELRFMDLLARQAADYLDRVDTEAALKATQTELRKLNDQLEQRVEERSKSLEETERRFRLLVEAVADYAIFMLDPDGHIVNWNTGARRIKGYPSDEIIGRHFSIFYTEEDRRKGVPQQALATASKTGRFEIEGWRVRKDGTRFWANVVINAIHDLDGRTIGFAKVTRDLTERRAAEERLRQAQKLEAVGHLTGGIAHDFNNMLTVVAGSMDMLLRRLPHASKADIERFARSALQGTQHAAVLTSRLLAFSRRQPLEPKEVAVNSLISGMSEMLRRTLGENIAIEIVTAAGAWPILVDPNQLENAVLNLAINARDAMPDGGKLMIEAANVYLDEDYAAQENVAAGQYVGVFVSDTGTGMTRETAAKAFEPFFTTKEDGHGTGLGLSQVFGFIKQSNGHVKIYSELNAGTTVKLYLPRHFGSERPDVVQEVVQPTTHGSGEAILVVDDDADVRSFTVEMLRELGYIAIDAANGVEGLRLLDMRPDIKLLFTDMGLPGGMNGRQLADEAKRRRPALKVLFTSGYARNAIVHHGRLEPGVELLPKPYSFAALGARVRRILDAQ
jgi:PAS domain S-box-containing protein